jgi:hypothetical protein
MQVGQKDQPGDEGPGLLGIPGPKIAKFPVARRGAGNDSKSEKTKRNESCPVSQLVEDRGRLSARSIEVQKRYSSGKSDYLGSIPDDVVSTWNFSSGPSRISSIGLMALGIIAADPLYQLVGG